MKAKSRDSMAEGLKRADVPSAQSELRLPAGVDLGELFLSELKSRRERLARWVQLLTEEFEPQPIPVRVAARPWHRCRRQSGM